MRAICKLGLVVGVVVLERAQERQLVIRRSHRLLHPAPLPAQRHLPRTVHSTYDKCNVKWITLVHSSVFNLRREAVKENILE